jgi:cysteinyl-tRNA synthetase
MWSGFDVTYVRNITDIEDKIIAAAAESGESVETLAERMSARFSEGYEALGVLPPDLEPKATEHIAEIIEMIQVLVDRGLAYPSDGDVYFSVRAKEDYGKLSGRNPDELRSGYRIEVGGVEARPPGLRPVEGDQAGGAVVGLPLGGGETRMAYRVLGHGYQVPR